MARPRTLTTNRVKPQGSRKAQSVASLRPRRFRGIRPAREFSQAPEVLVSSPYQEDTFELRFLEWTRIYGGNRAEFIAWLFLTDKKKLVHGQDFLFQTSLFGGRTFFGGAVADFTIPGRQLAWRIQGEAFHIVDPAIRARDELQKTALVGQGWRVVDIFVQDLYQQRTRVLEAAWEGIQVTFLQTV